VRNYLDKTYLVRVRKHYPDQDASAVKLAPRPAPDGLVIHENLVYARWGDRAELTLINAPHGFILFSPHQALALDHLERFFGKHLGQTRE